MTKKPLLKVGDPIVYKGKKTTVLKVDPGSVMYTYAVWLPTRKHGWWVHNRDLSPATRIRRP